MDSSSKSKMSLRAPAKVNLKLKIIGRRADGYHLLDMVMVKLDLADEIDLELGGKGIRFESESDLVPKDRSNSVWRAAERILELSHSQTGVTIRLRKKTPVAAGLGGGSSDAAAVLMGLNQLLDLGWSSSQLIGIGVSLGADVPFFLVEGAQKAGGIGEKLEPLRLSSYPLVLVNPGFPILTAEAYRWYDEEEGAGTLTIRGADASPFPLENDLEKVVIPRYPVLSEIKQKLIEAGALGSLLSGSGATVFGLFTDPDARDRGYEMLNRAKDPRWWMCRASTLEE